MFFLSEPQGCVISFRSIFSQKRLFCLMRCSSKKRILFLRMLTESGIYLETKEGSFLALQ